MDLPKRTFHKWRIAIEEMFGLIINNENQGEYRYYIANDEELRNKGVTSWLINSIGIQNVIINSVAIKDRIILENVPSGQNYLTPIIEAMKGNNLIHFTYYNYWTDEHKHHCVEPYCVKLFRQRWYLVGKMWGPNEIIVYSLDRMSDFRTSERTFNIPSEFNAEDYFENFFGVTTDMNAKLTHIKLKATKGQANYLRDLPLKEGHQIEIERNDKYSIFDVYIRPTYDFMQEILWMGAKIEVLEPKEVRELVAKQIDLMHKKYKE